MFIASFGICAHLRHLRIRSGFDRLFDRIA